MFLRNSLSLHPLCLKWFLVRNVPKGGTCLQDKLMKTFLKLAAVAALVAIQPVFAGLEVECLIPTVPDSGATALLTLLGVGGLVTLKSFIKKS